MYERALAIDESIAGPTHPDIARDCNNLASLLKVQGDVVTARAVSHAMIRLSLRAVALENPTSAHANEHACAFAQLFERTLTIWRDRYGEDHSTTAHGQFSLGALLVDEGEYAAARPLLVQRQRLAAKWHWQPSERSINERCTRRCLASMRGLSIAEKIGPPLGLH